MQDQLDADEHQDHGESLGQIDQPPEQALDDEIQLPQAHQGEDVGGQHQIRLRGQSVDRGDGIEGEDQVGGAEGQDDQSHRRDRAPRAFLDDELAALPAVGDAHVVAGEPDQRVLAVSAVRCTTRQS